MKYPRLFWAMILPIAAVSFYTVTWLAPLIAPPALTQAEIQKAFFGNWVAICAPEPLEQMNYVLAVLVPAVLMFGAVLLLRRLGLFQRAEPQSFWVAATAIVAQLVLVCYAGYAWVYESEHGWKTELYNFAPAQTGLGLCVAGYFGFHWLHPKQKTYLLRACQFFSKSTWLAWLIATGWAIAHLLCCVFTDDNIATASRVLGNVKYQMSEFAAVVNGRIFLVNFQPVYENFLAYLLYPLFVLVGLNITTFTLAMCTLSLVGFLLVYRVFSRVTGSSWLGLLFYVPWVAISLANLEPPGLPPANNFQYYAVGPIRYFGLFLLAYLSIWYLTIPRFRRLVIASFVAGLVALNNLDFGVPAALGLWTCVIIFPPPDRSLTRFWRTLRASAVYAGSATLAIAAYWISVRVACGSWPNIRALTEFQRIFALAGYNLQKLPSAGLYWELYFTFIVAVLYAIFIGFSEDHQNILFERRLSTGMLAYGGVAGLGAMSYYIARSHPSVIVAIFAAWAFVLALLAHRFLIDVWEAKLSSTAGGYSVYAIPTVAVLALCSGLLPLVLEFPTISGEYTRWSYKAGTRADPRPSRLVSLISKYVKKNDPTVIIYTHAHWLAIRASVQNAFPFVDPEALILKAQLQPVFESIERLPRHHEYVFGDLIPPITEMLSRTGFERIEADGDFAVWRGPNSEGRLPLDLKE